MADKKSAKLGRLLRVRTLQLDMVRAAETVAREKLGSEQALRTRIEALAQGVAPRPSPAPGSATSLIAAAHYRDRLHQSADACTQRVAHAQRNLDHACAATKEAKRDQSAMEKLMDRAQREAARRAMRALEDLPSVPRKRHDPC